MARIRTIKPEFFTHEDLFLAEQEENLPLRIAFAGLWTICDREGRFKWRPNTIKLAVLPFDNVDFSRVLDALGTRGFIEQYACSNGEIYGFVPSFGAHQVINNREAQSLLPSPFDACATRDPRGLCMHRGKGREGKGKEEGKEGKGREGSAAHAPAVPVVETELQAACKETWKAYANAHYERYGTEPVRNQKVNSLVKQFVQRIGFADAPYVAAFYVRHNGQFYVQKVHPVELMLKDAEGLRTQWATNRTMTGTRARQMDRTQANGSVVDEAMRILEGEKHAKGT
jgi:hypothetical protein